MVDPLARFLSHVCDVTRGRTCPRGVCTLTSRTTNIPQTILSYVKTSGKDTPEGEWERYRPKPKCEIRLASYPRAHGPLQKRNNGSSMRQSHCSKSQTNRPTLSRLSNRVWEASTPSSNTMKCLRWITHETADRFTSGMQRRRR